MSYTRPTTEPQDGYQRPSTPRPWVWKVPRISDATKYRATVENTTATQDAAGAITVDLNGGAALDIIDGLAFSWPLNDLLGTPYQHTSAVGFLGHVLQVLLEEGTGGPDTLVDDLLWGVAIADGSDPAGAAVTGVGVGVAFTGGNRKVRAFSWADGAAYAESVDPTNDTNSVTIHGTFPPYSSQAPLAVVVGVDSTGAIDSGQATLKTGSTSFGNTSQCYLILFFGRSSADADTTGGTVTLGYMANPQPFGGYTL